MRVAFVVDGFNLYHSLREAARASPGRSMKWLDLNALCGSYTATVFGPRTVLTGVYYFSALAKHLEADNPDVVKRHESYIDALRVSGVEVTLSNFKGKDNYIPFERCTFRIWPLRRFVRLPLPRCTIHFRKHEEKETDVAVATKMFELLHTRACDTVVIVSGDTDLLPAIRTARRLFPTQHVGVGFPFRRFNVELKNSVSRSFKIKPDQYAKHQFPDPIVLPNGQEIRKPSTW